MIGAIKIAFSGLAFVMANPVILATVALIGAPIGIAIGAGKLAEFFEKKIEGGSAFVDAQDQLDQQLKDAGMDSKGRIGYTNKRGRFIKKRFNY